MLALPGLKTCRDFEDLVLRILRDIIQELVRIMFIQSQLTVIEQISDIFTNCRRQRGSPDDRGILISVETIHHILTDLVINSR